MSIGTEELMLKLEFPPLGINSREVKGWKK
jgi:hypothetical protein